MSVRDYLSGHQDSIEREFNRVQPNVDLKKAKGNPNLGSYRKNKKIKENLVNQ